MSTAPTLACSNCGTAAPGAKFCPECGTPVVEALRAIPEEHPTEPLDLVSAAESPAPRRRPWGLVVMSAVAMISLLVGGFGVWLAVRASGREDDLSSQVASISNQMNRQSAKLDQQSAKLQAQQTQLNSTANAESIKGVNQQLAQVNKTLAQYRNCVPELQTELDGLTIDYNINWANPGQDYFTVNNGSQISNDCSHVLYPR